MTHQGMFNRAYRGVLAQGGKATHPNTSRCVYFDPKTNRRCGVGHVLPLPIAKAWAERGEPEIFSVSLRVVEDLKGMGLDYGEHSEFLESLQLAHDSGDFKENMTLVAKKWGLEVPS